MEFPPQILRQIALYLDYCSAGKYLPNKTFWIDKAEQDFSLKLSPEKIAGQEFYIKMAAYP